MGCDVAVGSRCFRGYQALKAKEAEKKVGQADEEGERLIEERQGEGSVK